MANLRGFGDDIGWHDKQIVDNWNALVKPTDTVLILGDFSFLNMEKTNTLLSAMNGELFIVPGNHDDSKRLNNWFGEDHVLPQLLTIKVIDPSNANDSIIFEASHYPLASWNQSDHGRLHLHGHLHSKNNKVSHHFCADYVGAGTRFDVGMDNAEWFGFGLSPIPLTAIISKYNKVSEGNHLNARNRAEKE